MTAHKNKKKAKPTRIKFKGKNVNLLMEPDKMTERDIVRPSFLNLKKGSINYFNVP